MASGTILQNIGALLFNELSTSISDFNITHSEVRIIFGLWSSSTAHSPGGSYRGFFIHLSSSDNYAIQLAANIQYGDKLFIRNKMNGTWNEWKTFTAS